MIRLLCFAKRRDIKRSGRGAVVAHPLWERGVASSNLAAPT
ncbi:uncharacterized protein METZ01_LOCUS130473, partial [marine metagenome]